MNRYVAQQEFQELEARIRNRFGHFFQDDVRQIEYKPLATIHLLEMSAGSATNGEETPG